MLHDALLPARSSGVSSAPAHVMTTGAPHVQDACMWIPSCPAVTCFGHRDADHQIPSGPALLRLRYLQTAGGHLGRVAQEAEVAVASRRPERQGGREPMRREEGSALKTICGGRNRGREGPGKGFGDED